MTNDLGRINEVFGIIDEAKAGEWVGCEGDGMNDSEKQ